VCGPPEALGSAPVHNPRDRCARPTEAAAPRSRPLGLRIATTVAARRRRTSPGSALHPLSCIVGKLLNISTCRRADRETASATRPYSRPATGFRSVGSLRRSTYQLDKFVKHALPLSDVAASGAVEVDALGRAILSGSLGARRFQLQGRCSGGTYQRREGSAVFRATCTRFRSRSQLVTRMCGLVADLSRRERTNIPV